MNTKKVVDNNTGIHYKMYKSGKKWVYGALALSGLALGLGTTTVQTSFAATTSVTTSASTQTALTSMLSDSTTLSAGRLANANGVGPFTAGVNQTIPYEAFGGDGMLTRLFVNGADKAPWSDNGTAKNTALLPVKDLQNDKYLYQVAFNGNLAGKTGQAFIDQLRADGAGTYTATVKVYTVNDKDTPVTTKDVALTINAATSELSNGATLSASRLANANGVGPFTAGVNQVIPYEAFGGDGMLTRLFVNGADKAPWSDNGTAKNKALLPLSGLDSGRYLYEMDFEGNLAGKTGQAFIDQLRTNGAGTYNATVKIYAATDKNKVIATKHVSLTNESVTASLNESATLSANRLANAKGVGPFTAGVNQVIPYEAFGGDGMLTRLFVNGADKAPWSDNGTAKNKALLPLSGLNSGRYLYEMDFKGNLAGKTGQDFINQLRVDGAGNYRATIKVYSVTNKTKPIATKDITLNIGVTTTKGIVRVNKSANVYNSPSSAHKTSRVLKMNSTWKTFTTVKQTDGSVWINLGGNQYVRAQDVTFVHQSSKAVNKNVTVNYVKGYGIALWRDNAGKQFAHRYLATGSRWHVSEEVTQVNGQRFLKVGTDQWIDARYTK
jgi:hypothetical protein